MNFTCHLKMSAVLDFVYTIPVQSFLFRLFTLTQLYQSLEKKFRAYI